LLSTTNWCWDVSSAVDGVVGWQYNYHAIKKI
jgi:hypothetical protein